MNHTKIIYPGTFDPITNGHSDIIRRATRCFPHILVAIVERPVKPCCFTIEERITLAHETLKVYPQVEVLSFNGLLVEFAEQHQAHIILRGLRAVSDFEYEFQLAGMNRKLSQDIETIFLTPDEQYSFISSSLVREISELGGDVSAFVAPHVEQALQQKFRKGKD